MEKPLGITRHSRFLFRICCSNVENKKTQMLHKFYWLKEVFQYNTYVTCRINYLSVKKFPQRNALTHKLKCYIPLYGQHKYMGTFYWFVTGLLTAAVEMAVSFFSYVHSSAKPRYQILEENCQVTACSADTCPMVQAEYRKITCKTSFGTLVNS